MYPSSSRMYGFLLSGSRTHPSGIGPVGLVVGSGTSLMRDRAS